MLLWFRRGNVRVNVSPPSHHHPPHIITPHPHIITPHPYIITPHPHIITPLSLSAAALRSYRNDHFGAGDLPILLAYPYCYGREAQLANCSGIRYQSSVPSYCSVVGIECLGECPQAIYRHAQVCGVSLTEPVYISVVMLVYKVHV